MNSKEHLHPSPRGGWFAVAAVTLAAFAFVTSEFLPVGLLPQISASLGLKEGVGGLMVTFTGLAAAVAAPATTLLARRSDRHTVLLSLAALLLVADLLSGLATSLAGMLAGRALIGMAIGGFWAVSLGATGRLVHPSKAALATALMFTGITFATVIGIPLGTLLGNVAGWRLAFFALAGLVAIALAGMAILLPRLPSDAAVRPADLRTVFLCTETQRAIAIVGLILTAHFASYTYIAPFLLHAAAFAEHDVTSTLLAYGLVGFAANLAAPRLVSMNLRGTFAALIALLMVAEAFLPALRGSGGAVVADIMAWGFAYGALPVCMSVWMQRTTPDQPEAGAALFVTTYQTSIALGSLVGGRVLDGIGNAAPLWTGGLLALFAFSLLARTGSRDAVQA